MKELSEGPKTAEELHMADQNQSTFEKDAADLFDKLEGMAKALKDTEYSAAVVDKGIAEAKILLKEGKAPEAEQKYLETKILVERADASIRAEPLAWKLFWLELAYLLLLLLIGYVTHQWPTFRMWAKFMTLHAGTAWFGALGGVTIGLFGLYTHIQARDFDSKFKLWYISKPIMGAIFGWLMFIVFYVGLLTVQGRPDQTQTNPLLLYVIAFLAGFSERFTIKIVDRIMQVLTTWEEKPTGTPGASS